MEEDEYYKQWKGKRKEEIADISYPDVSQVYNETGRAGADNAPVSLHKYVGEFY